MKDKRHRKIKYSHYVSAHCVKTIENKNKSYTVLISPTHVMKNIIIILISHYGYYIQF